jgi:DNA-binding response OmpR family regulator
VRLLVAEDDAFFRKMLQQVLASEYDLELVENGDAAWQALQGEMAPKLAILDWVMPGWTGPQICRKVRADARLRNTYLVLLTAKNSIADIVAGLRAGADDYVTKPFDPEELRARIRVGQRLMRLQCAVDAQVAELRAALARERALRQLLPVCPHCKAPRMDHEYQLRLARYLSENCDVAMDSCPHCAAEKFAGAVPDVAEVHS